MTVTSPVGFQKIRDEFGEITLGTTQTFNSGSGTVTAPAGAYIALIECWGGGGGGGGGSSGGGQYVAGGGGGGGYSSQYVLVTGGSTTFNYTVGAGGSGGAVFANGNNGSNTIVTSSTSNPAANVIAGGGFAGRTYTGTSGNFGQAGFSGIPWGGDTLKYNVIFAMGPGDSYTGGYGGTPYEGGSGGTGVAYGNGGNGNNPGGGGAGGSTIQYDESEPPAIIGTVGGNGASGRVKFTWYTTTSASNFAAYVRGGAYVPNYVGLSSISTTSSGLGIGQFLNAENVRVLLPSDWNDYPQPNTAIAGFGSYVDTTCSGASAQVTVKLAANGRIYLTDSLPGPLGFSRRFWWLLQGTNSNFYARFEVTDGALTIGTQNTNLQLNSDIEFGVGVSVACGDAQSASANGILSIRDSADNVIVSRNIYLSADASSSD